MYFITLTFMRSSQNLKCHYIKSLHIQLCMSVTIRKAFYYDSTITTFIFYALFLVSTGYDFFFFFVKIAIFVDKKCCKPINKG